LARIRTIKPDFFTSEDIVSLSPMARLLYIALWCESDREGRMSWKPATFKLRYFPGDRVNITGLCGELTRKGLVVLYGEEFAYIPTFLNHQHVNPREAPSSYPIPDASVTRAHASNLDMHAQGGREGKGKEGKGKEGVEDASPRVRGSRLSSGWKPSELLEAWACKERPDLNIQQTVEKFKDFWTSAPGSRGVKLDWEATFRNWVRAERPGRRDVTPDYSQVIANLKD
jgi:hypothetical protein